MSIIRIYLNTHIEVTLIGPSLHWNIETWGSLIRADWCLFVGSSKIQVCITFSQFIVNVQSYEADKGC